MFLYILLIKHQLCNQIVFTTQSSKAVVLLFVVVLCFVYILLIKQQLCNQRCLLLNVLRRWFCCLFLFYVFLIYCTIKQQLCNQAGPRSLVDRRVDSYSIRFLTAVIRASLGSHVGKPSSAYGWSGVSSLGSPVCPPVMNDRLSISGIFLKGP